MQSSIQTCSHHAFHGGEFFKAVGNDFQSLENAQKIINADVLDAWYDPAPEIINTLNKQLPWLIKSSPPTHSEGLKQQLCERFSLLPENILLAGGSSDVLFILFPNMLSKNDKVLILDPSYSEYSHLIQSVTQSVCIRYKLKKDQKFQIELSDFINFIHAQKPDYVVLINPNSPVGGHLSRDECLTLIKQFPFINFIIDETYSDYLKPSVSLSSDVASFNNLIIIKSMSKVFALSGLRIGYLLACNTIVEKLSRFLAPWSVGTLAQCAAIMALQNMHYYEQKIKETLMLKNIILKQYRRLKNIAIYNSCANFFAIELHHTDADRVLNILKKDNIFIRNCQNMSVQFNNNFLRIAVKNEDQNQAIFSAFKQAVT